MSEATNKRVAIEVDAVLKRESFPLLDPDQLAYLTVVCDTLRQRGIVFGVWDLVFEFGIFGKKHCKCILSASIF